MNMTNSEQMTFDDEQTKSMNYFTSAGSIGSLRILFAPHEVEQTGYTYNQCSKEFYVYIEKST